MDPAAETLASCWLVQ